MVSSSALPRGDCRPVLGTRRTPLQDMLISYVAPAASALAFSGAVVLYALGRITGPFAPSRSASCWQAISTPASIATAATTNTFMVSPSTAGCSFSEILRAFLNADREFQSWSRSGASDQAHSSSNGHTNGAGVSCHNEVPAYVLRTSLRLIRHPSLDERCVARPAIGAPP
jgi:hypothetical protein